MPRKIEVIARERKERLARYSPPGEEPEIAPFRKFSNDFGPPYGFASLGDYYGQNAPGFRWPRTTP